MKSWNYISVVIVLTLLSCSKTSNDEQDSDIQKTNSAPMAFDLLEVVDNSTEVELTPIFKWQTATDPEGDVVTYNFIIDTSSPPTDILSSSLSKAEFELTTDLEINTMYYWKVVAQDAVKNVTESDVFSFKTIAALPNEAPENFNLLALEDNSLDVILKPTFTWEEAIDADGDTVTYDFYLDTNPEPTTKLGSNLDQPSFTPITDLLFDTVYYWTVVAKDIHEVTTTTQTFSFVTQLDNQAIQVPWAIVEEAPIFPGCEDIADKKTCFNEKIREHISDNFNIPIEVQNEGIVGIVRVPALFTISTSGEITNIRARGPHPSLETEAIRVLSLLPIMTPGKQGGNIVDVSYSTIISLNL